MRVTIDEAGDHAAAIEIDDARPRRDMGRDLLVRTDCEDALAGDRHGLGHRERAIDGDDLAGFEHQIGGTRDRRRR